MTTGKTIALTRWTFVGKVMSLLFNMLSRLIIGEGNGTPLQYSCLENSMDREALASYIVHGIAKRLNTFILVTGRMGGKYLAKQGMGIKMKKSKSK